MRRTAPWPERSRREGRHAAVHGDLIAGSGRRGARTALDFAVFIDPTVMVGRLPDDIAHRSVPAAAGDALHHGGHRSGGAALPVCAGLSRRRAGRLVPGPQIGAGGVLTTSSHLLDAAVARRRRRCGPSGGLGRDWCAAWVRAGRSGSPTRSRRSTPHDEPAIATGEHVLLIRPPAPVPPAEHAADRRLLGAGVVDVGCGARSGVRRSVGRGGRGARGRDRVGTGAGQPARPRRQAQPRDITPVVVFLDLPDPSTLPLAQDAWTQPGAGVDVAGAACPAGLSAVTSRSCIEIGKPIPADLQVGRTRRRGRRPTRSRPTARTWTCPTRCAGRSTSTRPSTRAWASRSNLDRAQTCPPAFDRLFVLGIRLGSDADRGRCRTVRTDRASPGQPQGLLAPAAGPPDQQHRRARQRATPGGRTPTRASATSSKADPTDDPDDVGARARTARGWPACSVWSARLLKQSVELLRHRPGRGARHEHRAMARDARLLHGADDGAGVLRGHRARTRAFFNRFVIGRGTVPLVRVGRQPYGVLPATVWSRMAWWTDRPLRPRRPRARAARCGLSEPARRTRSAGERLLGRHGVDGQPRGDSPGPTPQQDAARHRRVAPHLGRVLPALRAELHDQDTTRSASPASR